MCSRYQRAVLSPLEGEIKRGIVKNPIKNMDFIATPPLTPPARGRIKHKS